MPCRNDLDDDWHNDDQKGKEIVRLTNRIHALEGRIKELKCKLANVPDESSGDEKAILCAVLTEIKKNMSHNEFEDFLDVASYNGDVDVNDWYKNHINEDEGRLKLLLTNYFSKHEIYLIKRILNKEGEFDKEHGND